MKVILCEEDKLIRLEDIFKNETDKFFISIKEEFGDRLKVHIFEKECLEIFSSEVDFCHYAIGIPFKSEDNLLIKEMNIDEIKSKLNTIVTGLYKTVRQKIKKDFTEDTEEIHLIFGRSPEQSISLPFYIYYEKGEELPWKCDTHFRVIKIQNGDI